MIPSLYARAACWCIVVVRRVLQDCVYMRSSSSSAPKNATDAWGDAVCRVVCASSGRASLDRIASSSPTLVSDSLRTGQFVHVVVFGYGHHKGGFGGMVSWSQGLFLMQC